MNEKIWGEVLVKGNDTLNEDIKCDILVIGGGIAGYLCAYYLQDNYNVVLVEKDTLFSKTTHKTTVFITPYQGAIYEPIKKKYGIKIANDYYNSQLYATKIYEDLIKSNNIDCDFKIAEGYLYTRKVDSTWTKELDVYQQLGIEYEETNDIDDVVKAHAAKTIRFKKRPYQFNPIKFLNQLKTKFTIYEHTKIIKIDKNNKIAYTNENKKITAKIIILATNFPIIDIPGWYFAKMYRSVSYVGVVNVDKPLLGQYTGTLESDYYYRNLENNKVIYGGLDHKTGRGSYPNHYQVLIKENYPYNQHETTYNTIDSMTFDRIPFIGSLGKKDLYVITGFSKYGMTNSMLAANIIKDTIMGIDNPYAHVVSTSRHYLSSSFFTFALNMSENLYYIIKQLIGIPLKTVNSIKPNSGDVVLYKGRKLAVYRDSENKLHTFSSRCSHFNCQLKWNSTANCFECPCHGSRYDIHGHVIYEPACFDKKEKEFDNK